MEKVNEKLGTLTPAQQELMEQERVIKERLSGIGRKLLVMSGKGGVGKSTIAAYLALLLSRRGRKVGLLDLDLHGPSISRLMGVKGGLDMPEEGIVAPHKVSDTLSVFSLEMMLGDKDTAVIWRGPMKISAIRQFISDIEWGDMDYLIIDSPPGTGDEPLTVSQTIPDLEALVITTPQEVSLADVRKSINFCRQVKMDILGVIENMSGFSCPHCSKSISIFGKGGGVRMAKQMDTPFLGEIPVAPVMVEMGDKGELTALVGHPDLEVNRAYGKIIDSIEK